MLIVMRQGATLAEVEGVVDRVEQLGFSAHAIPGETRTAIGITGNPGALQPGLFTSLPGVMRAIEVSQPFKLVSREVKPEPTVVRVGEAQVGDTPFAVMAGPCAVEGRDQIFACARTAAAAGATFLRGGAFKPRTSPYSFQGLKEEGLELMAEAADEAGLKVVTEVTSVETLPVVAKYADVLQIGARNMSSFALLEKVGAQDKPILLKRGMSATIKELLMAAEYIANAGNYQIILCERGIRTFETMSRNTLDLGAVAILKTLTHLPVIVDPSHGLGRRDGVTPLSRAAVAVGADGLMVEIHPSAHHALSDGPQSLPFDMFEQMMSDVRRIGDVVGRPLGEGHG